MINEIFPHRFDNRFISKSEANQDDFILHYADNSLLLKLSNEGFEIPQKADFPELNENVEITFLFSLNNKSCFLLWDKPECDDDKFIYKEISFFRTFEQKEIAWVSIAGYHLLNWYNENKFCGKCGSATEIKTDERAIKCNHCGNIVYPKISPAIIVAVICDDKILLAHNSNFRTNWYSLVAGYADVGESLEETVLREVKEEVGLDVKNIRYYKSQPWPFSGSMMIGFFAEADYNQEIKVDNIEITEAEWFTRGNLPNHPPTLSIAGEMIEKFEDNRL